MNNHDNLWLAYKESRSPALKEKLIIEYATLVKYVAGRLMSHVGMHVDFDDLVGYGVFGLIDAIDKFDIQMGVKFETYASTRIRGAIIDHIRRMDWVPRTLRQKSKQLEKIFSKLEDNLGRPPTDDELASELGLSVEETQDLISKSLVLSLVSLDDVLDQNYETNFSSLMEDRSKEPDVQAEKQERTEMLADAISKLSEKERLVITLYYFEGLTLKEISSIMGVTESRISQIHTKALSRLQLRLGRFKSLLFM